MRKLLSSPNTIPLFSAAAAAVAALLVGHPMIELPEAVNIASQTNRMVPEKRVAGLTAGHTPHKLVWYYGDRSKCPEFLVGQKVDKATALGGACCSGSHSIERNGIAVKRLRPGYQSLKRRMVMIDGHESMN